MNTQYWLDPLIHKAVELQQSNPHSFPLKIRKRVVLLVDGIFTKFSESYRNRRTHLANHVNQNSQSPKPNSVFNHTFAGLNNQDGHSPGPDSSKDTNIILRIQNEQFRTKEELKPLILELIKEYTCDNIVNLIYVFHMGLFNTNKEECHKFVSSIREEFIGKKNQKNVSKEEIKLPTNPSIKGHRIDGLPGEWFLMNTSQVKEDAQNACTTIAVYAISQVLENPKNFVPMNFAQYVIAGSKFHKQINQNNDINLFAREVINNLNVDLEIPHELSYDPAMNFILENAVESRVDLTQRIINIANGQPLAATLSDGRETIAFFYKNAYEMYILDSHQAAIRINENQIHNFEYAYVVKFTNKDDLDNFLFEHRFHVDEVGQRQLEMGEGILQNNGVNQMDATIFSKKSKK